MNFMSKNVEDTVITGLLIGIVTSTLTFGTLLYWNRDGFDIIEASFTPIFLGFIFFISIITLNIIKLNKSMRQCLRNNIHTIKRIYQILLTFIIGLVVFVIIDIIFYFIDNSISIDFANALKRVAEISGTSPDSIEITKHLPFSLQTISITFPAGLVGSFISLPFIRKK